VSKRTSHKALIAQFLSSTVASLCISIIAINAAHAEQYCKSVDKDGNATYTLAPKKGCHAKKMKTVAVSHYITPAPAPTLVPATAPSAQKQTDAKSTDAKSIELKSNPTQNKSSPPVAAAPTAVAPAP
jgi:hypothetical protein